MNYPFLRRLLFRFDPEAAHELTLRLLWIGGHEPFYSLLHWLDSTPTKPVTAFGLIFRNPVGLAAGYDKDALAVRGLTVLGFGHVEVGTVTPRPQPGNGRPRLFRLPEDEALINRLGFPSRGSERVQNRLGSLYKEGILERLREFIVPKAEQRGSMARAHRDLILGVNLGKNKDTPNEQAVLDYLALLQNFAALADYLVINLSSPNTAGLRLLQRRDALEALLTQLRSQQVLEQKRLNRRVPLLVKLAPDLTDQELEEAVGVSRDKNMDGIIVTNTTLAREGLQSPLKGETGGLSGRPLAQRADSTLAKVVEQVKGGIPVIGVGGIITADDAKRKIDLGATLVQVYTGLIYRGPSLVKEIVRKI